MTDQHSTRTTVLYNAACPVCRREIDHYAKITRDTALPIEFEDLNVCATPRNWGMDADTAAQRLHVRKDGVVLSGIPAFIALWQEIPRYRWLARLLSQPGIHRLAVWTYDGILAPALYAWHRRRTG
jgi:predicted DCC family thiol-disulfide oxidoreductase YuxK